MKKTVLLPDINVWVALSYRAHVHHADAVAWFAGLSNQTILFCRLTQQGYLRLSTNASALPNNAVTMTRAWQNYDSILKDSRVRFHNEPAGLEAQWRALAQGAARSPKVWNDAYLAAFALLLDCEFVTFDKGFTRYPGLTLTLLP